MKFGKVKTKVVAGVVAAGIAFSGAGFALANTDAGAALKQWYNGLFGESVERIDQQTNAYLDDALDTWNTEYENLKNEISAEIDLSRETATGESLEEIVQAKLQHLSDLDAAEAEILANIGLQYYNVMLDGYFQIGEATAAAAAYAENDLQEHTGALGEEAVAQLTGDINTARDAAVSELEEAIQAAQEALAAEVAVQEELTVRNLQNQVDWAVEDLTESVEAIIGNLVDEQKALIVAAANNLTDQAKSAMDAVIENMGN